MKTYFVSYQPEKKRQISLKEKLGNFIAARRRGGAYGAALKTAMQSGEESDGAPADRMRTALCFLFGGKIASRLLPEKPHVIPSDVQAEVPTGILFHFTPAEKLKKIQKQGLRPKNELVFLTDDVDYFLKEGYLQWKTQERRKDTVFCALTIDAAALRKTHWLRALDRPHEFAANDVPPQYILWDAR